MIATAFVHTSALVRPPPVRAVVICLIRAQPANTSRLVLTMRIASVCLCFIASFCCCFGDVSCVCLHNIVYPRDLRRCVPVCRIRAAAWRLLHD